MPAQDTGGHDDVEITREPRHQTSIWTRFVSGRATADSAAGYPWTEGVRRGNGGRRDGHWVSGRVSEGRSAEYRTMTSSSNTFITGERPAVGGRDVRWTRTVGSNGAQPVPAGLIREDRDEEHRSTDEGVSLRRRAGDHRRWAEIPDRHTGQSCGRSKCGHHPAVVGTDAV